MATQEAYNIDCMDFMKSLPDKYFDLAVVDPPYGDGSSAVNVERESLSAARAGLGQRNTRQEVSLAEIYGTGTSRRRKSILTSWLV